MGQLDAQYEGDLHAAENGSQDQARSILTEWRNDTLAARSNHEAALEDASRVAELFKVLSDPTRVRVVRALILNSEMCVCDLAGEVQMSQSSVSHHLRVLRHFGLVRTRRVGREIHYTSDDSHLEMLLRVCMDHLREE